MISDLIKERATFLGITNAKLADVANTSQSQISAFLNKNASLTTSAIDNLLDYLGIDIETYENRRVLAEKIASVLIDKQYSEDRIRDLSKHEMAKLVDDKRVDLLIDDITEEEYNKLQAKDTIIPIECTYAYFKMMVIQYVQLGGKKPTPKGVISSYNATGTYLGLSFAAIAMAVTGLVASSLVSTMAKKKDDDIPKWNSPLIDMAKSLLK